jgi:hypothetical protein
VKPFNQKVLDRKRQRISRRISTTASFMTLAFIIACSGFMAHYSQKSYLAINAPSWADFKLNGPERMRFERVGATDPSGLPAVLTINGEHWEIVRVDSFNDSDDKKEGAVFSSIQAETFCDKRIITYIRTDDPAVLRANMWHEIMHAGACLHGGDTWWNSINPTRENHPGVEHLGEFLADFTHNNPLFMEWIAQSSVINFAQ